MSMPRTDIVLVSWNRPDMTELVIKTIFRNTEREHYRLLVVDNGSPEAQQTRLQELQDDGLIDELLLLPENTGLEMARNIGMDSVQSEYFVCVDNDCLPPQYKNGKDWLESLYDLVTSYSNMNPGAIALRTQVMIGTGNIFEGHEDKDFVLFPHPGGSFRIMPTAVVKMVGGWRDDVIGRGSEERYIGSKLNDRHYFTAFATKIQCLHLFGVREKGTDRWGYPKDWFPGDTGHSDIFHPKLEQGDDFEEVKAYAGEPLARKYFGREDANRSN
jgi:glycosyltransferase involved in cell wall biosynthesis